MIILIYIEVDLFVCVEFTPSPTPVFFFSQPFRIAPNPSFSPVTKFISLGYVYFLAIFYDNLHRWVLLYIGNISGPYIYLSSLPRQKNWRKIIPCISLVYKFSPGKQAISRYEENLRCREIEN